MSSRHVRNYRVRIMGDALQVCHKGNWKGLPPCLVHGVWHQYLASDGHRREQQGEDGRRAEVERRYCENAEACSTADGLTTEHRFHALRHADMFDVLSRTQINRSVCALRSTDERTDFPCALYASDLEVGTKVRTGGADACVHAMRRWRHGSARQWGRILVESARSWASAGKWACASARGQH